MSRELSDEHKCRISTALKGKKKPPRTIEHQCKLSAANRGKVHPHSEETKCKISSALKGRTCSVEHRRKNSEAQKRRKPPSEETRRRNSEGHKGLVVSDETRRKISVANKGKVRSEELKHRLSELHMGKTASKEAKLHRSLRMKELWKDPLFAAERMRRFGVRPNNAEQKLSGLLNTWFPNEWKYVGNGELIIGGKIPDFANINGKKLLIELFGTYWHSKERTGIDETEHEQERINCFTPYGYETLVVWEQELKGLVDLRRRVIDFVTRGEK